MACDFMNQGLSQNDLVEKLSLLNPGLNHGGAMKFAALASSAYCPDFLNRSSTQNNSPYPGFKGIGGQLSTTIVLGTRLAPPGGLEPPTLRLTAECSAN